MKKNIIFRKVVMSLVVMLLIVNQFVITASAQSKAGNEQPEVYHDYAEFQAALSKYMAEYEVFTKLLIEHNKDKEEHDLAVAEAEKIAQENAEKKAAYEAELAAYTQAVEEYNQALEEVELHAAGGHYTGPTGVSVYYTLEKMIINYSVMHTIWDKGLSMTDPELAIFARTAFSEDLYTQNETLRTDFATGVDNWNEYAAYIASIKGVHAQKTSVKNLENNAKIASYFDDYKGVVFYHRFTSTTEETVDNIPAELDNPTLANINSALTNLFKLTNDEPFDGATENQPAKTFYFDQTLIAKWNEAINATKADSERLYMESISKYNQTFKTYNASDHSTAAYAAFKTGTIEAHAMNEQAIKLITGGSGDLLDKTSIAEFQNDLKTLSASDLALKYGYTKLLTQMANIAVFGYFHLLKPNPNEIIAVATASSFANNIAEWTEETENHKPTLVEPTKPTPPVYEEVPSVPQLNTAPFPPIKPIYEPLNTVELLKIDKETGAALSDATFEVRNSDSNELIGTYKSDSAGLIVISDLMPGHYTLTETIAPEGYVLDTTPIAFEVKGDENEVITLQKDNSLAKGSVILNKADDKTGNVLEGAVFELQEVDGTPIESGLVTDTQGNITVNDLSPGDYQFVETKAPAGYELDETPLVFTIVKGQTKVLELAMTNTLQTGGVVLTKTDAATATVLQGAVFELQTKTGEVIQSGFVTGTDGKLAIDELTPGDYQLVETQAPTGYVLDTTPIEFTIEKNQTNVLEVSMTNEEELGGVVLTKTDKNSGEKLVGAVFEVQTEVGEVIKSGLVTGADGKVLIDNLKPGNYQFVETQAPTGYVLDETPIKFTIIKHQTEQVNVSMVNELLKGGAVLTKTDAKTGSVLQGAVFEVQDEKGHTIQSNLIAGQNGKVVVVDLEPGNYQFVETQAPTGYVLDETPVPFTVVTGQTEVAQVTMTNALQTGGVSLTKSDRETGNVLQGAKFEIRNSDGDIVIEEVMTGIDGKVKVSGLEPGDYVFIETQAPAGYILDETPVPFTIKQGQTEMVQVTKTNDMLKGSVQLTKIDADTAAVLAGAIFKLENARGEELQNDLTTDVNGKLVISNLKPGDYQLVETQAPAGYELDTTPVKFSVVGNNEAVTQVTKENKQKNKTVILQKKDAQTGELLAGAVFKLVDENDKVVKEKLKSDASGAIEIQGLALGKYKLIETQAPDNYKLDATPLSFTLRADSTLISLVKYNDEINPPNVIPPSEINPPIVSVSDEDTPSLNTQKELNTLPKTGDVTDRAMGNSGLLVILLGLCLIFFSRKQFKTL